MAVALATIGTLIVPTVQAALELANFIQSSYALHQQGKLSDVELADAWKQAGLSVQSADVALTQAEADAKTKEQVQAQDQAKTTSADKPLVLK